MSGNKQIIWLTCLIRRGFLTKRSENQTKKRTARMQSSLLHFIVNIRKRFSVPLHFHQHDLRHIFKAEGHLFVSVQDAAAGPFSVRGTCHIPHLFIGTPIF